MILWIQVKGKGRIMEWKEKFDEEEIVKMATAIYNANFKNCRSLKEDLLSEGVLGIMQAIANYDSSKGIKLSTYAWNVAKGKMVNFYNAEKESRENLTILCDCEWVGDGWNMVEVLEASEKMEKFEKIVGKLKKVDQFIVWKICEGYTRREVAMCLGVSTQCVSAKWKKLQEKIIMEFNGEEVKRR